MSELESKLIQQDQAQLQIWYARNPRVRTESAAKRAIKIDRQVTRGDAGDDSVTSGETRLFEALHVCAYRGTRRLRGKNREAGEADRREWIRRWQRIRDYIVSQNLGLAYLFVSRFRSSDVDDDDLYSDSLYALLRAVERFDPWRGFKFSTFACNVIVRDMIRRTKQANRYRRVFPFQLDPPMERPQPISTEEEVIPHERVRRALKSNRAGLTDLENLIISQRFPMNRATRLTLQEVGEWVGVSKERVRQIQNQALEKLRVYLDPDAETVQA